MPDNQGARGGEPEPSVDSLSFSIKKGQQASEWKGGMLGQNAAKDDRHVHE